MNFNIPPFPLQIIFILAVADSKMISSRRSYTAISASVEITVDFRRKNIWKGTTHHTVCMLLKMLTIMNDS